MNSVTRGNSPRIAGLGLMVLVAVAGCSGSSAEAPSPPTNEALMERCRSVPSDYLACNELGMRLLASKETELALDALARGCSGLGPPCIELGLIHYEGTLVPKSLDKALDKFGSGCIKRQGEVGCAYEALVMLEIGRTAKSIRGPMDLSCRYNETTGWPCYNLGVGLSCGLFGPPERENALGALQKGCRLGDDRACKLHLEYGEGRAEPLCTMIGGDPKRPVAMDLKLAPHGQVAVEPEGAAEPDPAAPTGGSAGE